MADGAMLKQDWGNVFVEGYRCSVGSEKSCQRQGSKNRNRLHRQAYTDFGRWCRAEGVGEEARDGKMLSEFRVAIRFAARSDWQADLGDFEREVDQDVRTIAFEDQG